MSEWWFPLLPKYVLLLLFVVILICSYSQIEAADAQLRSSRQFLEEQAAERETEREELLAQIAQLKAALREQKMASGFDDEAKLMEQQLEEAQKLIKVR